MILKKATNNFYDNMNLEKSVRQASDLDAEFHQSPTFLSFFRLVSTKGMKAASGRKGQGFLIKLLLIKWRWPYPAYQKKFYLHLSSYLLAILQIRNLHLKILILVKYFQDHVHSICSFTGSPISVTTFCR